jgi:hypothetical protein
MYALLEQSNERPPSAEEIAKNWIWLWMT